MEEQIKSTMQFFFYILRLTILINQCFIAQNFILILYTQPVQMNITTNLKTLLALCVTLISFKCSLKSKRYVGITHTFEIGNMHFSHKFCNFTRTFFHQIPRIDIIQIYERIPRIREVILHHIFVHFKKKVGCMYMERQFRKRM